jgi:hypothetical protein
MSKVSPGQPFEPSAGEWNSFVDAADHVKRQGGSKSNTRQAAQKNYTIIRIYNDSGAQINRFEAVGISDVVQQPGSSDTSFESMEFMNNVTIKARKPAAGDKLRWIVAIEDIPTGNNGLAAVSGIVPCKINLQSTSDLAVEIEANSTVPKSGKSGFEIVWKGSSTGNQLALVNVGRLVNNSFFPVKVTKTGGSDGTNTTAASWTYTVKNLDDVELGTGVSLAKPRPYGKMTYGSSHGLAFYDGATLKLWDAGEVPGSVHCPSTP